MKINNRLMLAMAFLLISFASSFAQDRGDHPSAEEMAKRQTERMTASLELSEEQAEKVAVVNLKYAKQIQEKREAIRKQEEKDREAIRVEHKKVKDAHNTELKAILTDIQYAKLEGMQEARGERARKRGGKKGKRGEKKDKG